MLFDVRDTITGACAATRPAFRAAAALARRLSARAHQPGRYAARPQRSPILGTSRAAVLAAFAGVRS